MEIKIIENKLSNLFDYTLTGSENYNELLKKLSTLIQELIDYEFETLLRILYRIDVSEHKVKEIVDINGPKNAAESIAKLIIEREVEKIETRKKYQQNNQSPNWEFDL